MLFKFKENFFHFTPCKRNSTPRFDNDNIMLTYPCPFT